MTDTAIKLMHGDCLSLMAGIPDGSIDMILADLPYGTTACKWDTIIPLEPLWAHYKRVIKRNGAIVLTASQPFTSALVMSNPQMFRYQWVWEKTRGSGHLDAYRRPLKCHEDVLVFAATQTTYNPQFEVGEPYQITRKSTKTGSQYALHTAIEGEYAGRRFPRSVICFGSGANGHKEHETQKPVALMEYLIRTYTNEGETVLDNTMGSGTTLVAAINTGRKAIGMELDARFYEIARKRVEEALMRPQQLSMEALA
jgi:hypothetical protein